MKLDLSFILHPPAFVPLLPQAPQADAGSDPNISTDPSQAVVARLLQPPHKPGGRQMLPFRVWIEVDNPDLLAYIPGNLVYQMEQDLKKIVYYPGIHILPDWMHGIAYAELDDSSDY